MKLTYKIVIAAFFFSVFGALVWSANHYHSKYQAEKLRADKAEGEAEYQGKVIANQALNFNRFNQIAENASRLNSLVDIGHEKTVIKYREVLLREKNCDFLFLLILLSGCSTTRTVYAPAHCTPIPGTLTQPVIVPLPPER